ncbi:MAG: hypothetical protein GY758_01950 [Fuerstiella sp.]|nr:hypothetical protein [Fuerstiella sp.]MCP4510179.1 hypothetical protein [Fuerstiella sp.]
MSDGRSTLNSLMSHLRQERDKVKVRMHLAEMEAMDEYDRLSDKFDELAVSIRP